MITIFCDFRQFSANKLAFFQKSMFKFSFVLSKKRQFFCKHFWRNYFKNHSIGPRSFIRRFDSFVRKFRRKLFHEIDGFRLTWRSGQWWLLAASLALAAPAAALRCKTTNPDGPQGPILQSSVMHAVATSSEKTRARFLQQKPGADVDFSNIFAEKFCEKIGVF
jgi:hypothetical protein